MDYETLEELSEAQGQEANFIYLQLSPKESKKEKH